MADLHNAEFPYPIHDRQADLKILPTMDWWCKHDPDRRDPNWGRGCVLCGKAVPAGFKDKHGERCVRPRSEARPEFRPKPITPAEAITNRVSHDAEVNRINGLLRAPWTASDIRAGRRVEVTVEKHAEEIAGLFRAGGWQVTYISDGFDQRDNSSWRGHFIFKPSS